MENVNQLMEQIPAAAADLSSNLSTVLQSQFLSPEQIWSVALTSSFFVQHPALTTAVLGDARGDALGRWKGVDADEPAEDGRAQVEESGTPATP